MSNTQELESFEEGVSIELEQMEGTPLLSSSSVATTTPQSLREKIFSFLLAGEVGALGVSMIFNGMSWSFYSDAVHDAVHNHDPHDIQEAYSRARIGCWISTLILLVLFTTLMTSLICQRVNPEPENTISRSRPGLQ